MAKRKTPGPVKVTGRVMVWMNWRGIYCVTVADDKERPLYHGKNRSGPRGRAIALGDAARLMKRRFVVELERREDLDE